MTTPYKSRYSDAVAPTKDCVQFLITTATPQTITVPGTKQDIYEATFHYPESGETIWVGYNVSPTIPASPIETQDFVAMLPKAWIVRGGDEIILNTPDTSATGSVSFRRYF